MLKRKKIGPILLLTTLFSVVVFVGGVSYGRSVAKIDFESISIAPTLKISMPNTPDQAVHQAENEFNDCSISFLYPFNYKANKVATDSGDTLSYKDKTINVICDTDFVKELLAQKTSTLSGKISINKGAMSRIKLKENTWLEVKKNNAKSSILISISAEIDKLITRTLIIND